MGESFGVNVNSDRFNPVTYIDNVKRQSEVTEKLNHEINGALKVPAFNFGGTIDNLTEEKNAIANENSTTAEQYVYIDVWKRAIEAFIKTMKKMSFKNNHFLFIDGLDVRPADIETHEYRECIGALVRAVYDVNTKILCNLFDDYTYLFKVIALTRTDIFLKSELVNVTSKVNDNCVVLDWTFHNEREFKYSKLNRMLNHILRDSENEALLDKYFGFEVASGEKSIPAALYMQRYTRLRPRDFVNMLRNIQDECRNRGLRNPDSGVLQSNYVRKNYSRYYVDQVRSEMVFRYTSEQYSVLDAYLRSLRSKTFAEEAFKIMVERYQAIHKQLGEFGDYKSILNLLYSLDLLGWRELRFESRFNRYKSLVHWHFREVAPDSDNYEMPWDTISNSNEVYFIFHMGVDKEYSTYT